MALLSDTTPISIVTQANVYNFSVEEKQRREAAIKNKDYFYDNAKGYLNLVSSEVDAVQLNLTAPIIKKKASLLYSRPLKREIVGPSSSITALERVYTRLNIDYILRYADLMAELTGTTLVFVGLDEAGEVILQLYDASEFSVVENSDDTNEADAISLISKVMEVTGTAKNPQVNMHLDSEIWTENYVTTYVDGTQMKSRPNEYGVMPFTKFCGEDVYGQYLGHAPATSIVEINATINQMLTNLGFMIKFQSASPIALAGFSNGEGIQIHPGRAINMPAGATASVLNMQPKITESLESIEYLEKKIFECSSIPKISIVGDDKAESGKALQIRWDPLMAVFSDKTLRYSQYEKRLANKILEILEEQPIESIDVSWPEEKVLPLMDDMEDLEKEMKIGLITPIDVMLTRDPSMSEPEATALIAANKQFNKQFETKQVEPAIPDNGGLDA